MSKDLKYLYKILLGGGKIKKIEVNGNLYVITTVRTVYTRNGLHPEDTSESEWQEVHVLRPQ